MAEPKKRLTSTRSGNRRSHLHLEHPAIGVCSNCKADVQPHTVCTVCGYYKGKQVLSADKIKKTK